MKNPELFNKTVDILVKSYHEGTLAHHEACGCVLGNIIAHHLGVKLVKNRDAGMPYFSNSGHIRKREKFHWTGGVQPYWAAVQSMGVVHKFDFSKATLQEIGMYIKGKQQLALTGYNSDDLILIEQAFEGAYRRNMGDRDGYAGLMAVVEALQFIHEADEAQTNEAKTKFGESQMGLAVFNWEEKTRRNISYGESIHAEIERHLSGGLGLESLPLFFNVSYPLNLGNVLFDTTDPGEKEEEDLVEALATF